MVGPFHEDMAAALHALRAPRRAPPAGAVDAHAHVFGPFDRFPLSPDRTYTPPLAPVGDFVAMLDRVGIAHGVAVHAGANGYDNRATLDARAASGGRLAAVGVVAPGIGDDELARMDRAGMSGLRFTEIGRPPGAVGTLGFADLEALAPRLKALGWHAQIWARAALIRENRAMLEATNLPLIFDHMGYFDVEAGPDGGDFRHFVDFLADHGHCVKITALRVTRRFPDFEDVRPFFDVLARRVPAQLVWGSDWPFISLGDRLPDAGRLLDLLDLWCGSVALADRILADNPGRFYRFRRAGSASPAGRAQGARETPG